MAILHPFKALRPRPDLAAEVACVPYDVIDSSEARALAYGLPHSFLHVIRPEISLAPDVDEHADEVYEEGARQLARYRAGDASVEEAHPALYVYRLIMSGRSQVGVFGCVAVSDYDSDVILKHEKTRPDKEDDRTRHILTQRAHAEPVMLAFRHNDRVEELMQSVLADAPLYDFVAVDGIQHTMWSISDTAPWVEAFAAIPSLYVADGHHRCKAASRTLEALGADAPHEARYFPATLFPASQMQIMAYNRVIKEVPGGVDTLLERLSSFGLAPGSPAPDAPGKVSLYAKGAWWSFTLPETQRQGVADTLDVARLSEHVLEPFLDIQDARTSSNIAFVGGIRGTDELVRLVDGGRAEVAFSMYPTSMDELFAVSDAGELMPPKSTWFEPKLRSGLLVHVF